MKLKSIPDSIMIYGAPIKGCKVPESAHMITFFNTLRREYPEHAKCCLHIRNEGKRTRQQIEKEKAEGFITGAADIILVGNPSFVCEMKSQSPSAKISQEQIDFLLAAQQAGAFVCIALGHKAAIEAFNDWVKLNNA
mgnify:FL=1